MKKHRTVLVLGIFLLIGFCLAIILVTVGSGLTLWMGWQQVAEETSPPRPTRKPVVLALPTPTPIPAAPNVTPTAAPVALSPIFTSSTATSLTPVPSPTSTDTVIPTALLPSPTPLPPTATLTPTPPPPTDTPLPTDTPTLTATPTPALSFTASEVEQFPTSHLNFDVFIAVTDANNTPLSGYRVVGYHSDGLQVESDLSANRWTENSGAMHYKAGNIKYQVPNSPGGVWTLQLVNEASQPVASPLEFPFDPANPTWYFILYRLGE